jgi:hypothetical protein
MARMVCMEPKDFIFVGAVCLVLLLVALFSAIPGRIARSRNHSKADAIRICGYFSIILWPLWIVAVIWAHSENNPSLPGLGRRAPKANVPNDGPGRYLVEGQKDGRAIQEKIDAKSRSGAIAQLENQDVLVTGAMKIEDEFGQPVLMAE